MDNKIRFAVIGYGHIGKRHAQMIRENEEAELTAVVDTRSLKEPDAGGPDIPFFNALNDLLQSNIEFDVLCIATPNGLHEEHALNALDAGKHVVIEKPMALSKAGCEKIISKALNKSRQVFCVMQNRYSPPSQWLKKIITDRILGKIFMVQINCFWNRDERYYKGDSWHGTKEMDGGTLFTQFSHFIDTLYWLFGDITNIHSRLYNFNHHALTGFEDSGIVTFDFIDGGMGCINFSTSVWEKNLESSITIIAEKGSIKIGGQYMNEVEYCNIKDYTMPGLPASNPPGDYGTYKGPAANHRFIIKNVIDVLKQRTSMTSTAAEGLKVVEIIERIYNTPPDK